jgi:signal transduction histidine kinase
MEKGNTTLRRRRSRSRHRWHYLYYLLATFNLLTVSYSLYLNHQLHSAYQISVENGQNWHARFVDFSELFRLANDIKAPVDEVLFSGDVERRRVDLVSAYDGFQEFLGQKLRGLTEEAELIKADQLLNEVNRARKTMHQVYETSEKFLEEYRSLAPADAARRKAGIDQQMREFYSAISGVNVRIGTIQIRSFERQLETSEKLRKNQYLLVVLVMVMLALAVFYGRRITERMDEDALRLDEVHRELIGTARQAGMAEIATGVLHNVGNVLNSVNVSANVVTEKVKRSKSANVGRVSKLLEENGEKLGPFFTDDPKGKQIPGFLKTLAGHLETEQRELNGEMGSLSKSLDHIKSIIAMQQGYAKVAGVSETMGCVDIVEDAIRLNAVSLQRHEIELVRKFSYKPEITVERHKLLQILVNLMRNAKDALDKSEVTRKRMTISIASGEGDNVRLAITDNGVGMTEDIRKRLFQHGFTTRKEGHGFGLHSGALAAKEMGGSLSAHSDGENTGATFTLELPLVPPAGDADEEEMDQ